MNSGKIHLLCVEKGEKSDLAGRPTLLQGTSRIEKVFRLLNDFLEIFFVRCYYFLSRKLEKKTGFIKTKQNKIYNAKEIKGKNGRRNKIGEETRKISCLKRQEETMV